MAIAAPPVSPAGFPTPDAAMAPARTPGFDERWAAWQARGAAHDRTMRRRMMFAAPILAIGAVSLYVLLLR